MKFDPKKHDDKVKSAQAAEDERIKADVASRLGKFYESRLQSLRCRRRMTVEDLHAELAKLAAEMRAMVIQHCSHPSLAEFQAMTIMLLDDKVEELRLTENGTKNVLVPWDEKAQEPNPLAPAKVQQPTIRYTFANLAGLEALEPVARVKALPEFIGWILDGVMLLGLFPDGAKVRVGRVLCGLGMESVPTVAQFAKGLEDERKRKARNKRKGGK